jgi:hypothetical protein
MSEKVKRYVAIAHSPHNDATCELKEQDNGGLCLSSDYDRLLFIARELTNQLQIAAHFIDAVSPWSMPVGWERVVKQADTALAKAREEGIYDDE